MALNKEDIAQLTNEELVEKVKSEKALYTKMKFNHTISPIDNPLTIRAKRRDIARLMTELRKRQLEGETAKSE
jgi:large subunit ribosomal protein L29